LLKRRTKTSCEFRSQMLCYSQEALPWRCAHARHAEPCRQWPSMQKYTILEGPKKESTLTQLIGLRRVGSKPLQRMSPSRKIVHMRNTNTESCRSVHA
jgi:hypothetical protein